MIFVSLNRQTTSYRTSLSLLREDKEKETSQRHMHLYLHMVGNLICGTY